jgi:hypothetical protein
MQRLPSDSGRLQLIASSHNTFNKNIISTSPTRSTRTSIFAQYYQGTTSYLQRRSTHTQAPAPAHSQPNQPKHRVPNTASRLTSSPTGSIPSANHTNPHTVKMVEPLTMIVIPLAVTFSAIICATAVQKRWQSRNIDDGNKYNRMAHKSRRFRHRVTGKPVPPKFECPEGCRLT